MTIQGLLRPIDTKRIANQLDLIRQGSSRGSNNLPASSETNLDVVELSIVQQLTGEWSYQRDAVIQQLKAYHDRLGVLVSEAEISKIKIEANTTISKMRQVTKEAFGDFIHLVQDEKLLNQELNDFKSKHRLSRSANLNNKRTFTVGFMILLVLFESILNGVFFAKGNEFGLIGGILTAIGISISNVAFSFLTGWIVIRFINYRNFFIKILSMLLSIIFVFLIMSLHLFAAHLREVTSNVIKNTIDNLDRASFLQAQNNFLDNPFLLHEMNSWYLFIFGVLTAIFAIYKGYTFDDPYPFYGNLTRRLRLANDLVQDRRIEVFGDLEDERDEIVNKLKLTVIDLPNNLIQANAARSSRNALLANFEQYEKNIETAINHLLRIYRDENSRRRKTSPPEYFSRQFILTPRFTELPEVKVLVGDPNGIIVGDGRIELKGLEKLSEEVINTYEKLLDQTVRNPSEYGMPDVKP